MSLEQALAENTAALNRLATVLVSAAEAGAIAAPAPAAEKAPRGKKAEAAAAAPAAAATAPAPAAAAASAPAASTYLNEGDAPGTRYFHIPAHNTVYKQGPNDPDCAIAGAMLVSGAEYLLQKAALEKKFPTAAAAAAQDAAPVPAVTAPSATAQPATASAGPTFADVIARMRELHAAQQNAGVKRILDKYQVPSVPSLEGKAPNATLIADVESALMGL